MKKTKQQRQDYALAKFRELDLSHTMYKDAEEKYKTLAETFNENGISCTIYPQGSFATGTVIRPYKKGKDANYDLDAVCVIDLEKKSTSPQKIKTLIGEIIEKCGYYKTFFEYEKCWTIVFAQNNGIGFNIDVVTSVDEDIQIKNDLIKSAGIEAEHLMSEPVSMAKGYCEKGNCKWVTINPKGYAEWFNEINARFETYTREQRKIFESKACDHEVEPIPSDELRSALQIAIQIMKRHRDVYYCNNHIEELKPISAIITTIAAEIAKEAVRSDYDPFEMLEYILRNIDEYHGLVALNESVGVYASKTLLQKRSGSWYMRDPAYPKNNLLDSWDNEIANHFFRWVNNLKKCFLDSFDQDDDAVFFESVNSWLSRDYTSTSNISNKSATVSNVPTVEVSPRKPWRGTLYDL